MDCKCSLQKQLLKFGLFQNSQDYDGEETNKVATTAASPATLDWQQIYNTNILLERHGSRTKALFTAGISNSTMELITSKLMKRYYQLIV